MAKTTFVRFNSTAELSAVLNATEIQKGWDNYYGKPITRRDAKKQKDWCGEVWGDALELLSRGDAEKASRIKAEGEILAKNSTGKAPEIKLDVWGCVPSVPNYLRGVPTNMMRVVKTPRYKPVVDIYVDSTIYDGISEKAVAEKAAMVANVITATELAGVRVNLFATCGIREGYDGTYYGICVKVKDATAPLNLLNIAFPICSRAFCRSIFVGWMERFIDHEVDCYGKPMKGADVQDKFKIDGLVLSIRDMVDNYWDLPKLTTKVNNYINKK